MVTLLDKNTVGNVSTAVLASTFNSFKKMRRFKNTMKNGKLRLVIMKKDINSSGNLEYIVPVDERGLKFFMWVFNQLELDTLFPGIRMYSAYFMQRSRIPKERWHTDSNSTGKKMRNIIIPLQPDQEGHLLVRKRHVDSLHSLHKYKFGEARINYDGDWHSSQPYKSNCNSVFLVFTCGEVSMTPKENLNGHAHVKDTSPIYFDLDGTLITSDELFYDSDDEYT